MNTTIPDKCIGQLLGNCRVEKLVSRSVTGTVYYGQQLEPARPVAITLFQLPEDMPLKAHQKFRARFQNEASALLQLSHPHLLPLYDYGEWEDSFYLIFPYMTKGSLATRLQQKGSWSPTRILLLLEQATKGLEYAHRNGQVHGMLTPTNLLKSAAGTLQISALGLQRLLERRNILPCTQPSDYLVTLFNAPLCAPKYLAPEYRQGQPATIRSDIYSLGIIIAELLTGSFFPKELSTQELLADQITLLPTFLQPFWQRTLAQEASDRFPRMSDLLASYAELVDTETRQEKAVQQSAPLLQALPFSEKLSSSEISPQNTDKKFILNTYEQRQSEPAPLALPSLQETDPFAKRSIPVFAFPPSTARKKPAKKQRSDKASRRQVIALLAGGGIAGVIGVEGINMLQRFMPTQNEQQATASIPATNAIGQTSQPINSSVAFIDKTAPEHRQRLLIHLPDGRFVAYKQGCTHVGVLVNYNPKTHLLVCPAHGAIFDPAQNGRVMQGPATTPLPTVAIKLKSDGTIMLL